MSSVLKILQDKATRKSISGIPGRPLNRPLKTSMYSDPIGIEIELEGANLPNDGYLDGVKTSGGVGWLVKTDGSLRNGLEYVIDGTCKNEDVPLLIHGLFSVFEKRGTRLVPSNRCSIHVHYNIGGLKVNAITSIFALWTVFEEPLLRWWGDARYKNHFCLSSKDENGSVEAWTTFLRTGAFPEANGLRYTALNLVAIRKYGSLEFRGGGAVTSPEQGIIWTSFLYKLCEYAKDKYENPQNLAYDLSERGAAAILEDICGEEFEDFFRQVLQTVPDFDRCCRESFHNIQPIIFGFPWADWLPEINKTYVPNPFGGEKSKATEGRPLLQRAPIQRGDQWVVHRDATAINLAALRPQREFNAIEEL